MITVNNGIIYGINSGKAIVTATFLDYNQARSCEISVVDKIIDIQKNYA